MRMRLTALGLLTLMMSALALPARAADVDVTEKLELCTACHGENGIPEDPLVPVLWGQEYYYLYVQLRDYQAGRRQHEIMTDIAKDLTKDEMKALAKVFSDRKWPGIIHETPDDAQIAIANGFITAGQCSACHLGGFNGNSRVPRLAGQKVTYLMQTMQNFRDRKRLNAPDMNSLMEGATDETLSAVAAFIAAK